MNYLSLDKTLTPNPFLSVSSLHNSRTSKSLCFPKKSNKVLVSSDKYDNSSSIHFSSKKSNTFVVFADKDDNSSIITSGVLSRTHFYSKKSKTIDVFADKDDNSSLIASGVLSRTVFSSRRTKKVAVFASKDDRGSNKLDQWDQMELKFGRLIGEDPKLTLAKPDPMMEALEAVVGDHDNLNELQAAELDTEWPDVESLIKELQQFEGISNVSKGRYFLSPGLAPTFQVYMASMFENQYKLLARSGNRVQEVTVETSLGKEEMKSAIQSCTNKVA